MRDFIKSNYNTKEYKWGPVIVENKCIPVKGEEAKSASDVQLNPTQKFVTKFFCPESPYKGMLLWHSVGTGKTCSGVSIASTTFERAGYSILWVTRSTLKSDIWKNIFDQICHSIIRHEVDNGLILPEKITARKKLISENWLEPMSYKQFSNLLAGKNKNYDILKMRNGADDILKKTLIIIDEGHKLYGGDLKYAERPNTDIMEKLIMNSYNKSGDDSCKLLVMTATPFTNSPLELFSLTNLFMTNKSEKITTDKLEFKKEYMTEENILSQSGSKNIANKLSGYISYLNREKDATQFAQPIMINVPILMATVDEDMRDAVFLNKKIDDIEKSVKIQIDILNNSIKSMKMQVKNDKQKVQTFKNQIKAECMDLTGKDKKTCQDKYKAELDLMNVKIQDLLDIIDNQSDELYEIKNNSETAKNKQRLAVIKKSLLQEYMLYKQCAHLKYTSIPKTQSKTKTKPNKKAKSLTLNRPKLNTSTRKFKSI